MKTNKSVCSNTQTARNLPKYFSGLILERLRCIQFCLKISRP